MTNHERGLLTRRLENLALALWDDTYLEELQHLWKEGRFTKKRILGPKFDKRGELISQIDGHWQTACDVAKKAAEMGLPISYKSAVKLLKSMADAGEIELHVEEWVDERFRKRRRFLYRKVNRVASVLLLQQVFGHKVPDIPCTAMNIRRHTLKG